MKSARMKMTAILLMAACTFAGCTDALYVMTPEEENAVISYASHVVAKYNTYQQDGEIFVMKGILDGEEEPKEELIQEDLQEEDPTQKDAQPENSSGGNTSNSEDSQNTATISEALGLANVQADYMGNSLCTTYEKSDVFVVDAAVGKQLLVLNVKLTNQTGQDAKIDILMQKPAFQIIVNEGETAMAQTTILPNDLSTYQADLAAGEAGETVLLFQIPQEIQEIDSLQLRIIMNDMRYTVPL